VATDLLGGALRARRTRGVQAAVITAALIVALRFIPLTSGLFIFPLLENFAYDTYFDLRPADDMSRYVIVAVDDASLQRLGRFPWSRSVYAQLLDHLGAARVVAFDVLFSEAEASDPLLAAAIQRHGRVVLAAHRRPTAARVDSRPIGWRGYGPGRAGDLPGAPAAEEFVGPVPTLAQAAAGTGYADIEPDADGVYRRVKPLQVGLGGYVYPHLATEIARVAEGMTSDQVTATGGAGTLNLGGQRRLPLRDGRLLVNYAGPTGTVRTVPFWKVLAGEYPAETFRDRIVLVGATAAGLYDVRPAPFRSHSRVFYGVETNANIAHTLLEAQPLRDATGPWPWGAYALLVGALVGWGVWHSREWLAAVIGVGTLAVLAVPVFWVGIACFHQVTPYGAVLWAVAVPMAMALYERLGVEKREVQHQFATYVSPEVLGELAHHPDLVRQGRRRVVTLLFSDVRRSTALCEQVAPDVWIAQLNEYLSEMSDAIFAYDGYLDKFMGDGIMAVWNAFGNQPEHAELALKAAVQMLERLKGLNADWERQPDRVPFQIGIGLHTGEAIIGNVGSDRRAQYTAIGDTVNCASRLESLTKEFHAHLLVSETTATALHGKVPLVALGSAELLGREQPLHVSTLQGYPGEVRGHVRQDRK
jgi:adenylate cyclase